MTAPVTGFLTPCLFPDKSSIALTTVAFPRQTELTISQISLDN